MDKQLLTGLVCCIVINRVNNANTYINPSVKSWNSRLHMISFSDINYVFPLKRSTLTWVAFVYPLAVREVSILNSYSVFMSNVESCKMNQVVWLQLTAAYCVMCIIIVCSRDIWAQRQDSCVCFSRAEVCQWRHVASLLVRIQEHVFL